MASTADVWWRRMRRRPRSPTALCFSLLVMAAVFTAAAYGDSDADPEGNADASADADADALWRRVVLMSPPRHLGRMASASRRMASASAAVSIPRATYAQTARVSVVSPK